MQHHQCKGIRLFAMGTLALSLVLGLLGSCDIFGPYDNPIDPKISRIGTFGPAGGIIFYDKGSYSDGWRYLEAARVDQSTGIKWYNGSYVSVTTQTDIGSGKANTAAIIAAQGPGQYAASLCDQLVLGGYDDWFLPSKDELNAMYKNLAESDLGGFASEYYWSSSQHSSDYACDQGFGSGTQYNSSKYHTYSVRAIRAF